MALTMMKVLAAVAALGLATPGIATAEPTDPVNSHRAAVRVANNIDSKASWSKLYLKASRAYKAEPTFSFAFKAPQYSIWQSPRHESQQWFQSEFKRLIDHNFNQMYSVNAVDIAHYFDWPSDDMYELPLAYLK